MDQKIEMSADAIQQMLRQMGTASVFGEAVREGGSTIIPVASVMYGFGTGSGSGPVPNQAAGAPVDAQMTGSGGGGGGGGRAQPVGYIRIDGEGVRFEPIFNQNVVPVAGIAMVAWTVFWITATIRAFVKRK